MWGAGPDLPGEGEENLIAGGVAISSQSGPSSRPTLTQPNSFSSRFLVLHWIPAGRIAAVERVQPGSGGKRTSHFAGAALVSQSLCDSSVSGCLARHEAEGGEVVRRGGSEVLRKHLSPSIIYQTKENIFICAETETAL